MVEVLTKWRVINFIPPYGKLSTSEKNCEKIMSPMNGLFYYRSEVLTEEKGPLKHLTK